MHVFATTALSARTGARVGVPGLSMAYLWRREVARHQANVAHAEGKAARSAEMREEVEGALKRARDGPGDRLVKKLYVGVRAVAEGRHERRTLRSSASLGENERVSAARE